MADYDEMTASEVIADLNGPGHRNDDGEVWDGEEFVPPVGEVVSDDVSDADMAKAVAKENYLKTFRGAVETAERRLKEAAEALEEAKDDLRIAEVNAERWYR